MRQEVLANKFGVTFQQLDKYEKGGNHISAGRLAQLAAALGVPVASFFPDNDAVLWLMQRSEEERRRVSLEMAVYDLERLLHQARIYKLSGIVTTLESALDQVRSELGERAK